MYFITCFFLLDINMQDIEEVVNMAWTEAIQQKLHKCVGNRQCKFFSLHVQNRMPLLRRF